jgi:hypothetical protein
MGTQSTGHDLQKRVLFWLGGPRKAKRCDIYYDATLRSVLDSCRESVMGRFGPKLLLNQVVFNPDMAVFPLRMVITKHQRFVSDLENWWCCDIH